MMTAQAARKSRLRLREKPYVDISLAAARAVANLANSAGCMRSGPMTSHDLEPFISWGLKIVARSTSRNNA